MDCSSFSSSSVRERGRADEVLARDILQLAIIKFWNAPMLIIALLKSRLLRDAMSHNLWTRAQTTSSPSGRVKPQGRFRYPSLNSYSDATTRTSPATPFDHTDANPNLI